VLVRRYSEHPTAPLNEFAGVSGRGKDQSMVNCRNIDTLVQALDRN
jgi:hypothetical protein